MRENESRGGKSATLVRKQETWEHQQAENVDWGPEQNQNRLAALWEMREKICSEETKTGAAAAVEKLTRKTAAPVKSQIAAPLALSMRK
jgi:hypothetical protein